jgi:hypothetical protein
MLSKVAYATAATMIALTLAVVGAGPAPVDRGAQKPVRTIDIHGDGGIGPVKSLDELWSLSAIVVDAIIQSSRPADIVMKVPGRPAEDQVWAHTSYKLEINEVFRDTLGVTSKGEPLEVLRAGGKRERSDRIDNFVDSTFEPFQVGERYVFFLRPSRAKSGTFVMATGTHHSAFLLPDDATVLPRGIDTTSRSLGELSREEFLLRLRMRREVVR